MTGAQPLVATPSQTVGPFFHFALTPVAAGHVAGAVEGDRIRLRITVTDGDGRVVPDAVLELWVAHGSVSLFVRMPTGDNGTCECETARPGCGSDATGAQQAPHINVCLFARGLLRQLHTRIYFTGDPSLDADPVLALVPADRRRTLLATADDTHPGRWRFHIRLQGPEETAFFDA